MQDLNENKRDNAEVPIIIDSGTIVHENIYENLNEASNDYYYGNIYENICHNCGQIYDDTCGFCNHASSESESLTNKNLQSLKKLFKKHFKSSKKINSKIQKHDIRLVHELTSENKVFKTNCTFDMKEICNMHTKSISYQSKDHDQNRQGIFTVYQNVPMKSVQCWIKSLSNHTEEYDNHTEYNIKNIPSITFYESDIHVTKNIENHSPELQIAKFINSCKRHSKNNDGQMSNNKSVKYTHLLDKDKYEQQNKMVASFNYRPKQGSNSLKGSYAFSTTSHKNTEMKDFLLATMTKMNDIDDVFYVDSNVRRLEVYLYLNKTLLSISLNTITLSYDKYLKKISHCYQSKKIRKSTDYFCNIEVKRAPEKYNVNETLAILFKKSELVQKKRNSSIFGHTQFFDIEKNILSNNKNESLINLPFIYHRDTREPNTNSTSISQSVSNMDENIKTEVNNDIYYYIWNCDSNSPFKEEPIDFLSKSVQQHPSSVTEDEQYWISASDDFASAHDLMDVVDEGPQLFMKTEKINPDTRSYSNVTILYNENPQYNRIIYESLKTPKSFLNVKEYYIEKERTKSYGNPSISKFKADRHGLNLKFLQHSVREFLITIRDNEDEDELTINQTDQQYSEVESTQNIKMVKYKLDDSRSSIRTTNCEDLELKNSNEMVDKNKKEHMFIRKENASHQKQTPKQGSKESSYKNNDFRKSRRRSMEIEPCHSYKDPHQNPLRHAKSTSNLLEQSKEDQSKSTSNFITRFKNLFKKREVSFGPGPIENKVFGNSILNLTMSSENPNVPKFVVACITILETPEMIITHGLYRASGNKTTIDEIKKKINESSSKSDKRYDCLKNQEPNTLTGLLKQFFRELEPGLINSDIANQCIESVFDKTPNIPRLKKLIGTLETTQKSTLKYLIRHLSNVSKHKNDNKMDSNNLSIVWGPCIFPNVSLDSIQSGVIVSINRVVKDLIDHFAEIF